MMNKYNYYEAVLNDVRNYLKNEADLSEVKKSEIDELKETLSDILWTDDSVTGNGSGSYTFNACQAEENLNGNLKLLIEALEAFGCSAEYITEKGFEACDVTIRCYLLNQAIDEAVNEIADTLED